MSEDALNKMLRWVIIGGLFLVPFIPLIVTPSMFFPFITGKNFVFRIIVEIIFAAWIILMYRDAGYRPKFSWVLAALASFLGVIALADIFGENPTKSMWSNFERMEGFVALLHLGMYALVAGTVLSTQKLWGWFAHTSVGASVIVSIYSLSQLADIAATHQGSRLDATLGNASYLAVYMLFHIFILAFLFARHQGARWVRFVYGGILFVEIIILYHTATRGTILGLIGGVLVATFLISVFGKEFPRARKVSAGIIAAVVLFVGGFIAIKDADFVKHSPVLSRFASISFEERTTQSRFIIWGMALEGFQEKPILGWGQENFNIIFNKFSKPILYKQEAWFDRAHNVFLDWLTAGGILGLLTYLLLFAVMLWYVWRSHDFFTVIEKSILTGLLSGYFFHNLFVFDNIISYILFFSLFAYLYTISTHTKENDISERDVIGKAPSYLSQSIVSVIILVVLVFGMYFINVRGILTATNLLESLKGHEPGLAQNLQFFTKALSYNYATQEVNEQLLQFASRVQGLNAPDEVKQDALVLAEQEMGRQIVRQPNDARLLLFYGSFLSQIGQHERGLEMLHRAEVASPQKQLVKLELGNTYLSAGAYDKALEVLKVGFELEPTNARARAGYAVGAIYANRRDIEDELLSHEGVVFNDAQIDQMINAYAARGRVAELIKIWEKRVTDNPENAQFRLSLGASYAQNGQFTKAITEIQKTIELNSEFKEQGEYYISELRAGRLP